MIDISSLNSNQLNELEKLIKERKTELKRQEYTKDKLIRKDNRIIDYLIKRFPGDENDCDWSDEFQVKIAHAGLSASNKITKSMLTLCDVALGNYYISGRNYVPKEPDKEKVIPRPGSDQSPIIRQFNSIPPDISDDYIDMWNELLDVFLKYDERRTWNEPCN